MPRRSLHEDSLLVGALHLHVESGKWGSADLPEATSLIMGSEPLAIHVITRFLRKMRREEWAEAEKDPDTSLGPRYLYNLTEQGIPVALTAAGRELASGSLYPIPVLSAFGATALGQELLSTDLSSRNPPAN